MTPREGREEITELKLPPDFRWLVVPCWGPSERFTSPQTLQSVSEHINLET